MESLSRPRHGRNHSTSSILSNKKLSGSNGFSPKNAYDDVFSGRRKFGASKFSSRIEDYSEIFGGSEGSRACSIPFIDLSAVEETDDVRSSKLEYSQIFGGFRDEDVGVSYDEMLAEPRSPAKIVSSSKRSNQQNNSRERQEFSHVASTQSFDGVKQFNMSYHKSAQRSDNGTNGTTHIAQLHAVPGFTYFVDGKIPLQKAKCDQSVPAVKTDVYRDTNFSKRTMEGKDYRKVVSHLIKEQKSEGAVKFKNGSSHVRPNSDDELFHTYDVNLKTHLPKVSPPSSLPPKLFSSNGIPKRSVASKSEGPKSGAFDCSSVCSDEELDVNSAAAVSSAALRKAIERAQESIRMAKESMERSKVGFRSHSKPSSKGGLEVKERKESKVAGEAKGMKEKNPKGTVMQSGRVAPEFHEETMNKVKSAEECEVLKQTSEQANSGNHRTESVNTDECETKDMKAGKVILEMHEGNVKRAVERTFEWEEMEKKLKVNVPQDSEDGNILQPTQEVHEKETQKKEEAEAKERAFFEQERHEKILIDSKEPAENEKRFECRGREDESQGNQEEIIEQVVNERILEDDQEERENGNKLQDEIGKRLNESCGLLDCESKLKEFNEIGSNKGKRNDSCEGEENEKRLDQVFELEVDLDDKTQDDIHAEREAEKKVKEDYTWEGYEKTHVEAYAYEETESVQSETGKTENSEKIQMTTEAVKDEKTHDAADSLSGNQEACRYEENGNMAGVGQDVNTCEEIEKLVEVTKPFCEFREDETVPEPLEVIYESEKEETCKAADLVESAAENEMKDATDVFLFDGNLEDFGLIYASIAQKQIEQNDNGFELASNTENSISSDESEDNKSQFEDAEMAFDQEEERAHEELSQPSNKFNGEEETIDIDEEIKACQNTEKNKENLSETFDVEDEETEESGEKEVKEAEVAFDQVQDKINVDDGAHEERQWVEIEKKKEEFEPYIVFFKGEDKIVDIDENNEENLSETFTVEDGETEESVEKEVKDAEVAFDQEQDKINVDEAHEERQWVEIEKKKEAFEPSSVFFKGEDKTVEIDEKNEENPYKNFAVDGQETKEIVEREVKVEKEHLRKVDEANMREREREKQRIAVERAIREARERAFADARERAERAAVERATAEARQRVMAETREKFEKACAGAKSSTEKASIDAKIRSERAAVERATAEARERALEKALSQKTTSERFSGASRDNVMRQSSSANDSQRVDTSNTESAQRRKARLERHQRIMERAAKALGEKNRRDLLAQKEQAEKNRLAGALDADVKRWSSGKEGNLRALLSTLQYILEPDSGWQPVSLTEIVTTNAVKKAYRRATLYVHPDKLQQRGASIRQKYICEKVFDLLKAAWNKFNSEER